MSSLRRGDLSGLPRVATDVECESVDSGGMRLIDIGEPVILSIWVGIADHMVGDDNLGVAVFLGKVVVVECTERHRLDEGGGNQTKNKNESGVHR